MLTELLAAEIVAVFTVFARVGSAVMLLPGFGDAQVPPRPRLAIALALSVVVAPLVEDGFPPPPATPLELVVVLGAEISVGLVIGALTRILVSGVHTAGLIVAYQTGLAAAAHFDPGQSEQGALVGRFLVLAATVLIFVTDLHHLLIRAVVESYRLFPVGALPPLGDFAELGATFVSRAFAMALTIAAPLVVLGLVFYLGVGLLARLMPAVQVFFVAIPLHIALGFWLLMISLSASLLRYLEFVEATLTESFLGG